MARQGRDGVRFSQPAPGVLGAALHALVGGVQGDDAVVGSLRLHLRKGDPIRQLNLESCNKIREARNLRHNSSFGK